MAVSKKLVLILFAGISFATANAQSLQFGVKGGLNLSTLVDEQGYTDRTMANFNAGVFAKIHVIRVFSIQPELYYSGEGSRYVDDQGVIASQHINYLSVPLLAKFTFRGGFYLETGPQANFLLSAVVKDQGVNTDVKADFNSAEFAWAFGLGFKVPLAPIGFDFRYVAGVSNIVNDPAYGNAYGQPSVHNAVWQIGITYVLFKTPGK